MKDKSLHRPYVLVLTSTFPRWANDVEPAFVFELSRRLAKEFDVTVLSPRTPGSQKQENMGGLKVIRFPYFLNRFENLAMSGGERCNRQYVTYILTLAKGRTSLCLKHQSKSKV